MSFPPPGLVLRRCVTQEDLSREALGGCPGAAAPLRPSVRIPRGSSGALALRQGEEEPSGESPSLSPPGQEQHSAAQLAVVALNGFALPSFCSPGQLREEEISSVRMGLG